MTFLYQNRRILPQVLIYLAAYSSVYRSDVWNGVSPPPGVAVLGLVCDYFPKSCGPARVSSEVNKEVEEEDEAFWRRSLAWQVRPCMPLLSAKNVGFRVSYTSILGDV